MLLLTDADASPERPPVPILLATSAVHHRLVRSGLRTMATLVVESDEPREVHHFACLLGFGAEAICPRLALQTVASLAANDRLGRDRPDPPEAQERFRRSIEDGVLKVMSKMGISDVASYCGAQIFDALGLDHELVETWFPGTASATGGIGLAELQEEALARAEAAAAARPRLENPGYVKFRKGGEPHATNPDVVEALQQAVKTNDLEAAHALRRAVKQPNGNGYATFAALVNGREPIELRDVLELAAAARPVPLDEVEPAEAIVRRFSSGGMSLGALSPEAHEAIAEAFNNLGARSNSGEGGEDPARFRTERNSKIKQIASGRFGVTNEYAAFAEELQIKIAQGSKPGEGGQLPGHKVTAEIARLRHTQPGVALISPPPHHDIYSIEDLAQLIFDLRQVNPEADVSVKLVAEAGVGVVAAGVAKTLADVIHIAGADGGTGASPLSSIKSAGLPWEVGLAETQHVLAENGLRGRVRLRVDGGIKTGRDVDRRGAARRRRGQLRYRAADRRGLPDGALVPRRHLPGRDRDPEAGAARQVHGDAGDDRELPAARRRGGAQSPGRARAVQLRRGRRAQRPAPAARRRGPRASRSTLTACSRRLPAKRASSAPTCRTCRAASSARRSPPGRRAAYPISNRDRAVGARLAGRLARDGEPAPHSTSVRFKGTAGQSFGAFLPAGVEFVLEGEANDYVGKSLSGGRIVVRPPAADAGDPCLVGNTVLYGATAGELFCAGSAGERLAIRNSGATVVVEGAGSNACEYMTSGTVVVIGDVGRNVAAGMTGGELYVHDPDGRLAVRLNAQLVEAGELDAASAERLRDLLERHAELTGSKRAALLLGDWPRTIGAFRVVRPRDEVGRIEAQSEGTESGDPDAEAIAA